MLPRILEPEVMDSSSEAEDYNAMDHRAVNERFALDFLALHPDVRDVLDVGTGTALIPVEICRRTVDAVITAVDLAESMLAVARRNVAAAEVSDRVRIETQDAKRLTYPTGRFTAAISNSLAHHLPEPAGWLAELTRVTQIGGVLFVRDLLRPADRATLDRLVATYAADANPHQRQMFADSLHAALTLDEVRDMVVPLGFAAESVQPSSDRHWTWAAVKTGRASD